MSNVTRTLMTLKNRTTSVKEFYLDSISKKLELVQLDGHTIHPHFILLFSQEKEGKRTHEDIKVISEIKVSNKHVRFNIFTTEQYPELAKHEDHIKEQVEKLIKIHLGYEEPVSDTYY